MRRSLMTKALLETLADQILFASYEKGIDLFSIEELPPRCRPR